MKLKKKVVGCLLGSAIFVSNAIAGNITWNNIDTGSNDSSSGYESSLGNKYQYDLSKPTDRIQYGVDPAAQLRDSIDVNPTREIEQGIGQYGGGAYGR